MKAPNFIVATTATAFFLVLFGCGGAGTSTSSEFKGAYKAPYTNSLSTDGSVEIFVDADSSADIKVVDDTGTYSGSGTVSTSGQLNTTVTNGVRTVNVSSLFAETSGSMTADVDLSAAASGASAAWNASGTASFLAPTIGAVYNGDYNGTLTGTVNGTLAVDVNSDGTANVTVTTATGVYSGNGTITTLGSLNVFLNGSGAATGKTLSFKGTFSLLGVVISNLKHFNGSYTISAGGSGSGNFSASSGAI